MLRRIALTMQAGPGQGGNYLTGAQLHAEFEDYLTTRFGHSRADAAAIARAMTSQFRERNFILSRYGSDLYGFVHRAFLEHFCAEAYRWQFEKDQVITLDQLKTEVYGQHWADPAWREILRLIAGTIREQWTAQIVTYLADEVNWPWPWRFGDHPPWNIALAAQCLTEARTVTDLDQAGERVLARVIQLLEHSVVDGHDPTNLIQTEILTALAGLGPSWPGRDSYLRWYLDRGIHLPWNTISQLAARVATCLFPQEPTLVFGLINAVSSSPEGRSRGSLLLTLADVAPNDPNARDLLLDLATADDQGEETRQAAVAAVTNLAPDDPQVRDLLLDRATNDQDGGIRWMAAQILVRLATSDPQVRDLLLDLATDDQDESVRRGAVQALADLAPGDPQVRDLLLDRATKDQDESVRREAVQALARLAPRDPFMRDLLFDYASNQDERVRRAAVEALAPLAPGDPQVRDLLLDRVTNDQDESVRREAVLSLRSLDLSDPQVRDLLLDCAANNQDQAIRRAAVTSLSSLARSNPHVRDFMLDRAANDQDQEIRWDAVISLSSLTLSNPQVRDLLLDRAANDQDQDIRRAAAVCLSSVAPSNPQVRDLLLDRAANDQHEMVRLTAMHTLARLHPNDPHVRDLLLDRAANDQEQDIRRLAVQSLARLAPGSSQVRGVLLDRANADQDASVRRAAMQIFIDTMASEPHVRVHFLSADKVPTLDIPAADWAKIVTDGSEGLERYVISAGTNEEDRRWLRQLAVKVASCSASFTPPIEEQDGVLVITRSPQRG